MDASMCAYEVLVSSSYTHTAIYSYAHAYAPSLVRLLRTICVDDFRLFFRTLPKCVAMSQTTWVNAAPWTAGSEYC
jgi:hypothetical protein